MNKDASAYQASLAQTEKKRKSGNSIRNNVIPLHLMLLPGIILILIYSYIPMVGLTMAFQHFDFTKGFFGSEWVGLYHFKRLLLMPESGRALINTLTISLSKMSTMLVVPIIFALLLNEVKNKTIKKGIQTAIYLPHFLSWVIMAGIVTTLLSTNGLLNSLLAAVGLGPVSLLGNKAAFQPLLVITNLWKEVGFSTILFIASISNIDPTLYEAASIDGASRWKQVFVVTLPGMTPIIVLCLILNLGGILNAGFEQVFNLYSIPVLETGDIIDTLVYRLSFQGGQYELGTAVGLMKSIVSFVLVSTSYWLAYRFANYEIF